MKSGEARLLLGFPPNSRPTPSQVKAAYKRKVWDVHPDLFPVDKASYAESQFKMISEAYKCLLTAGGGPRGSSSSVTYTRVVRTGVPRVHGGRHHLLVGLPFLLVLFGTVGLGGISVTRAYRKEKEAYPSHNPFLP
ncbi:hypothetical protein SOVF_059780 isoform B [Spinacia oleracea]|uniref:Uncharacterized protein isoform X2 n=1 Tax=Spinacia oleracea TaxID=3562 RepID=A0ABM3QS95_SPIOL|nr:uncharacterized protein LOC110776211 isoform X2 [Spinacia oleracea]KNA19578.1 hypothetical protein SOVF_059780 isoform B [Spinacia oleracea]